MIGGEIAKSDAGTGRVFSKPGELARADLAVLWDLFVEIGRTWGDPKDDPNYQRSQWLEFIELKTKEAPSYLAEYQYGAEVYRELREIYGDGLAQALFFEHGAAEFPASRLAHFRTHVVEEFIQVWLTTGGFRAYGAGNYNSYVSGSRFAVRDAYRRLPTSDQAPRPQTGPADLEG